MEALCKAEAPRGEALELSQAAQLPESTNCLTCSEDGRYLGLGHSQGLSVWCASSLTHVANWLEKTLEITSLQMTSMAEASYLLGTIDDMGVARVFAYHGDAIHLLSVVNVMEDINHRSVCVTFDLSPGGQYAAATFSCNGSVWLEIHHFPSETWLKELETAQDPDVSEGVKWSPLSVATKIHPPQIPAGAALEGQALQVADFLTYFSALDVDSRSPPEKDQSCNTNKEDRKQTHEVQCCTQHFLLPCAQIPAERLQPELPVAVCVWWVGDHNLLQYSLQTAPKGKPDVEPIPDVLWPNAKKILCSAVSRCSRYIALGLDDALLSVWDRKSGSQLSVVSMPAPACAVSRIQFVDHWNVSTDGVRLLLLCKSGALHRVTTGRGGRCRSGPLTERPRDSGGLPTISTPVPFLHSTFLVMQRNGKMFLQDVIDKATVRCLIPPKTHLIATPCNPVYALNATEQTLFIRGDQDPSCAAKDGQSHLLILRFGECESLQQCVVPPDSPPQPEAPSFLSLDKSCNLYLQQRALSADERNRARAHTWTQLQHTAATAQQRHSGAAAE